MLHHFKKRSFRRLLSFKPVLFFSSPLDPFSILQITPSSSQKEIREAYLKLAKIYHPDKNPENLEKFKLIQQAYESLRTREEEEGGGVGGGAGGVGSERGGVGNDSRGEGGEKWREFSREEEEVEKMNNNFRQYETERNHFKRRNYDMKDRRRGKVNIARWLLNFAIFCIWAELFRILILMSARRERMKQKIEWYED